MPLIGVELKFGDSGDNVRFLRDQLIAVARGLSLVTRTGRNSGTAAAKLPIVKTK
jgi:hypothetical protein